MKETNDIKLPKGWKWIQLGELCKVLTGNTPPKADKNNYGNDIPFIKPPHLLDLPVSSTEEKLSFQGASKSRIAPKNSVLVSCIGYLGKTAISNTKVAFNQQINAILENENVIGKYLFYQAQSHDFRSKLVGLSSATTVAIVNKSKFETIEIPLAPFPSQELIVSKIEELFSELDNGVAQLKQAQAQLKLYRQSVLKAAFEGKLTEEWRQSVLMERIEPPKGAKKSKKGAIPGVGVESGGERGTLTPEVLPNGWVWTKLGDICLKIQDGSHFSPQKQYPDFAEGRYKYITAKNIRNDYIDYRKVTYVAKEFHDGIYTRCNPEYGDVLLTKDGVNTGDVTINTINEPISLLSSVCLFKVIPTLLNAYYLKYFLQSPTGNRNLIGEMSGTAIKRVVLKMHKT